MKATNANQIKNPIDIFNSGYCMGRVNGVIVTHGGFREYLPKHKNFCMPNEVTTNQTIKIVVKYLNDNPSELHLPDVFLIQKAIIKAFPCK